MPFVKISIHDRNIEVRKEAVKSKWDISQEDKKDLIKFISDAGLGKVNKGKRISEARQLKYLDILKTPLEYFNKPTSKITLKDVEQFEKDLISNKIMSYKNKPFENSTKADIRGVLKIYFKWKFGDTERYRKLVGWLDTRATKRTPDYLTEEKIIKIYKKSSTARDRFLIAVLFDTGARAEEFFNIRYEDIELPKGNEEFVKITLKQEYSKTKGRVIPLFWTYSLEAVREYLKEREQEGIKNNEPVLKDSYDNIRVFLHRLGKKVLEQSLHFHLFRHSSATHYASKMNRQQLCIRYGWAFSSNMVDVYISRAGMDSKELEEKFSGTKIEELKKEHEKIKMKLEEYREENTHLEKTMLLMSKSFKINIDSIKDKIVQELKENGQELYFSPEMQLKVKKLK